MHNFDQDLYKEIISMLNDILSQTITNEWLSINLAAKYVGVSYNTFIKFRNMGLKICEIDGIKRVSRKEIDRFLEEYSY
ncbi:helix-turn-helix domain-containing protein [Lysinibacillus sp. OF-1]|uniref:helix-turn-helix domain-containing protein n=1 Tax=Lysinibacillus sp. OF-1 TaxID=2972483 RepID=UPI00232D2057|nr:helix-turn-helix domain-containing protein [Lysinibacillus sp. OF-1]WCH47033.1 helix-turn-helix domain-containing protein [Lysinibacillus sp. OF-1]